MTALPDELVLAGHRATWVWADVEPTPGQVPAGLLVDHGDHTLLVPFVRMPAFEALTLLSLLPLTVAEQVVCAGCGAAGRIVEGEWLTSEVARG